MTQTQLAQVSGCTQRAISYYETEATYPPAPVVAQLARALNVTTDELLGLDARKAKSREGSVDLSDPELRRLWKHFQKVRELPEKDQRAVLRLIASLSRAA